MQAYWTLVRRELGTHFFSWTGYVVIGMVLFLMGLSYWFLLARLNAQPTDRPITELFYNSYMFWGILIPAAPIITMRAFAQEKSSGTFETLMTAPVHDLQVVLAKFSGAMLIYILMWLPSLLCPFLVRHFSKDQFVIDAGEMSSTFMGILLLGAMYLSLGCFASALTRSQAIAAVFSLLLGFSLLIIGFLAMDLSSESGLRAQLFTQVGLIDHMKDFARGVVDTRPVVFYLSFTLLFLFLTMKVVESRRWK
ncbi:MAG TPA: ABC transporter permease [Verrucomicrobiae bacterium]|jgi:ABC-2 type transport system permease protein